MNKPIMATLAASALAIVSLGSANAAPSTLRSIVAAASEPLVQQVQSRGGAGARSGGGMRAGGGMRGAVGGSFRGNVGGGYRGGSGFRGGAYARRGFGRGVGPFIGGLAAGAIVGGALANDGFYGYGPSYVPGPVYGYAPSYDYSVDGAARCEAQFRSFDRSTGTYTTYSGETRVCPYLR